MYLGEIYLVQGNYRKAILCFEKADKVRYHHEGNIFNSSAVYHNLGLCYFYLKVYDKAEYYLLAGLKVQEQRKDTLMLISSYMDVANLYYEQYKDDQAIPYFKKAYELTKGVPTFELKQNAALNMAVVEENRKNYPLSLQYRKEYESWKDSLNNQNKIWALVAAEKEYAVSKKEKEIKVLKVENELKAFQRNMLLLSSLFLGVLFAAGIYFFRQKTKSNRIILKQKQHLDALNMTKDKLFSIISHDLRSSVTALKKSNQQISGALKIKDWMRLDDLLQNSSSITNSIYNLLDNLLNWSLLQTKQLYFSQESIHLSSVVEQVEYNYKPLMTYKNIAFEATIPPHIFVWADLDSVKIILRNVLDNAIKFSEEAGAIKLYVADENDRYCNLVIEDEGLGMKPHTRDALLEETVVISDKQRNAIVGTGLGVQLCKEMIKKNNGRLMIESEEGLGTRMIIQLQKTEK